MSTKSLIWIGIILGSFAGGWLGSLLAHGEWLSWQSLLGNTLGALLGIYIGYKLGESI